MRICSGIVCKRTGQDRAGVEEGFVAQVSGRRSGGFWEEGPGFGEVY